MTTGTASRQVAEAPPFARDRVVHGWLGIRGIAEASDAALTIALAWTAVQLANPAVAGLVVAAGAVPKAGILLFGGVLADRFDTRSLLILCTGCRVAVLAGLGALSLIGGESVPLLLAIAVGTAVCDAIFEPAGATLGRQLVRDGDLAAYAGLGQTASRLGTIVGAAIGGGLVVLGGLAASLAVAAAVYLFVVAYLVVAVSLRHPTPRAPRDPVFGSIAQGFGYLRRDDTARTVVVALSGLNLAVTPAYVLGLALLVRNAGWEPGALGLLQAVGGVGAFLGVAAIVRWRPRRDAHVGFGLLVIQGLAISALALPFAAAAYVACSLIGLAAGAASALLSAVFVRSITPEYLGRVSSILRLSDVAFMPAAMAAFGGVASSASVELACVAFGCSMAALMLRTLSRPRVRSLGARSDVHA
jgi:MFS family permease